MCHALHVSCSYAGTVQSGMLSSSEGLASYASLGALLMYVGAYQVRSGGRNDNNNVGMRLQEPS